MYYFDEKFEPRGDFFKKFNNITRETKTITEELVINYLTVHLKMDKDELERYAFWKSRTIDNIDIDYEHGCFYHHWLNSYLESVISMIWCVEYYRNRAELDEKKSSKAADNAKEAFIKFAKENFR